MDELFKRGVKAEKEIEKSCSRDSNSFSKNKPRKSDKCSTATCYDIFVLADAFLSFSKMTHKKLQLLCYYAKAWYLALYDYNLIPEHFEAWIHGAMQPDLYQRYKKYGFSYIPQNTDTSYIPEEFLSFAREIYASYGYLTGEDLEKINHREKPWINARGSCMPWESCTNEISENDMKEFFRKMIIHSKQANHERCEGESE